MRVERLDRLSADTAGEVLGLAAAATDADGTAPLSELALLPLRHGGGPATVHLLARDDAGRLIGYAQVDTAEHVAELVVQPAARRHGVGRALATAAASVTPALRVWAHGDLPGAAALARSLGFVRTRVLYRLGRSLATPPPEPRWPPGVRVRTFRPDADDAAWLEVNNRAFAHHPEQGGWTVRDLRVRMAEPWFDPDGFLLAAAEPDDRLLGFHWTKIHSDGVGEVYVLGVDPDGHGHGLGTALTLAGLHYLRGRGVEQVMLYVDESNTAAVKLYAKLGFTPWSADVMYTRATA